MKLRELLDRMKPMFTGESTPAETAVALYGEEPGLHGKRLVIYDRVKSERAGELRFAFPNTAQQLGEAFEALAFEYFKLHPWGHADYRPDGDAFAAFVRDRDPRPWLSELARLEWELTCARSTTPHPRETSETLRLGSFTKLLELDHDLARWLREVERSPAPAPRPSVVVVWTRESGESHFIGLEDYQHAILRAVAAGELDLAAIPASLAASEHAVAGFVAAGVLVGPAPQATELVPTLGRQLSTLYTLAPFTQVRWEDGAMQLWSPLCPEVLASDDVELVLVATQFATPRALGEAVSALAERLSPADVVEIADALFQAQLLVRADAPAHPAVRAGWDPQEAAAYAITRDLRSTEPDAAADGDRIAPPDDLDVLRVAEAPIELVVHLGGVCYRYAPATHELVALGASRYAERVIEVTARAATAFAAGASLLSLHFAAGRIAHALELAGASAIDIVPADEPWSMLVLAAFAL